MRFAQFGTVHKNRKWVRRCDVDSAESENTARFSRTRQMAFGMGIVTTDIPAITAVTWSHFSGNVERNLTPGRMRNRGDILQSSLHAPRNQTQDNIDLHRPRPLPFTIVPRRNEPLSRHVPHDVLQLTLDIEQGEAGIESSGQDPLSRAWRVLLHEGRPVQATSLCLFADNAKLRNPRWLGMLVLSAADRIIFFPGLSFRPEWIRSASQVGTTERLIVPDHLTLERNRRDWHFTSAGSEAHQAAGRARPLDEGFVSWFGMTVASSETLAVLKQRTQLSAAIPSSDVHRRYTQLRPLAECQPQHLERFS